MPEYHDLVRSRPFLVLVLAAALLAPAALAGQPSPQQIVAGTARQTAKVRSFHFVLRVRHAPINPAGLSLSYADGDVAVPNELRARIAGTLTTVSLKSSLVFVGGEYFLQDPFSGRWRKLDAVTNPVKFFDPAKGVLSIIAAATGLAANGSERAGGTDCWRLRARVRTSALSAVLGNPPSAKLVPLTLWIGKSDLVLRRLRLDGAVTPGDSRKTSRQLDLSSLGESVVIKAPEVTG